MFFSTINQLTDSLSTLSQNEPFSLYDLSKDILLLSVASSR